MDFHPGQAEVRPVCSHNLSASWGCFSGLIILISALLSGRGLYSQFLREMIIQPGIAKANMGVSREDVTFEDHVSKVGFRG